jgi:hypothetical protein
MFANRQIARKKSVGATFKKLIESIHTCGELAFSDAQYN